MVKKLWTLTAILLLATVALSAGCKKKAPTSTVDARPPVSSKPAETEVAPPPSTAPRGDVTADVLKQDVTELNKKGYLTDAYFDYDQSDLREDARTALAADAEWLKKYPTVQVLIEGYCDERGTGAYNLALGDRRATSVRDYLASRGIAANRLEIRSFGEERPKYDNAREETRRLNRRAALVVRVQ